MPPPLTFPTGYTAVIIHFFLNDRDIHNSPILVLPRAVVYLHVQDAGERHALGLLRHELQERSLEDLDDEV